MFTYTKINEHQYTCSCHKSHCPLKMTEWVKSEKIILFVQLLTYSSFLLSQLFELFDEVALKAACQKYMRESGGQVVTRNDICQLAIQVYSTIPNIVAAFKRCGIHLFNVDVVSDSLVAPAMTSTPQNSLAMDTSVVS